MRISDWSSDVCSSDLATSCSKQRRMQSTFHFWRPTLSRVRHLTGAASITPRLTHIQSSGTCWRSEEHTSELQSLMRISYAVFCLKKKKKIANIIIYDICTYGTQTRLSTTIQQIVFTKHIDIL